MAKQCGQPVLQDLSLRPGLPLAVKVTPEVPGMISGVFKPVSLWLRSSNDLLMGSAKDFRLQFIIPSEIGWLPMKRNSSSTVHLQVQGHSR